MRIREELAQRGLPRERVEHALREADVDWQAQLYDLWQRRFSGQIIDLKDKARQSRFFLQRGYTMSAYQPNPIITERLVPTRLLNLPKSSEKGMPTNWVRSSAPTRSIAPMPISAP